MTHDLVYSYFRRHFPQYAKPSTIIAWFPNGYNSIRIRFEDCSEFIFTYDGDDDWCFETVDRFTRRLKGVKKCKCLIS